ncbi:amidohydrolase family protein [Parabacteroides distasonis]|uniref:amidohydrolase family protein n=1 Tax=Parabacteroides distasonis TaxID=823 RepID=UPI00189CF250|nr:amidohydrolase family protein [Parabacteroides distasonis]MDB9152941.1 amidohydrolase family protein [Parabacteroides distasonis]MDB9157518.1 amidohydrolase family protein [Parabacteroides distasonis]MDB9163945.1 amidohydrolase family protein [Parabacteroides distasonis]MDB9167813.1 amidohydrolase family protein [Parabacteroides distasonis]MDB9193640.1 amidohydrolase family protein [Parabacteroides distasonis]
MKRYSSYIDVHHHYNPLSMLNLPKNIRQKILKEEGGSMDISRNLDAMEKLGIEKSILSYPAWFPALTEQESLVFCTQVNECYANLISEHSCLGAFALLPVSRNHELVLGAMEYALDTLQLEGIVLPTGMQGVTLCSQTCFNLFQELNNRNGTIFFHPSLSRPDNEKVRKTDYEVMTEVTKITCELVFNKIPRKFPHIRFILPYGGGNTSFFFQDAEQSMDAEKELELDEIFKRLYYDTVFPNRTNLLGCLERFADKSHILFGSDFPSASLLFVQERMAELEQIQYKNGQTLASYTRQNAFFVR